MTRHSVCGTIAAAVGIGLTAGLVPLQAAVADGGAQGVQEVVIPAAFRDTVRDATLQGPVIGGADGAGRQGVFHTEEGQSGRLWTRFADGETFPVGTYENGVPGSATGSDVLAFSKENGDVELRDAADGSVRTITVPEGQRHRATYGSTALTAETVVNSDGTSTTSLHLLSLSTEGATRDVRVTGLPEGTVLRSHATGDDTSIVLRAEVGGTQRLILVDKSTGVVSGVTPPLGAGFWNPKLTPGRLTLYNATELTVLSVPRDDLSATPTVLKLGTAPSSPTTGWAVVGEWLVYASTTSLALEAVPLDGGPSITLLRRTNRRVLTGPDGTAVTVGGYKADDWGIRRVTAGPDGRPQVALVKKLPAVPATVEGLSLAQGRLGLIDNSTGVKGDYGRTLSATGTPTYGERARLTDYGYDVPPCADGDAACGVLHGMGDGRFARLERDNAERDLVRVDGPRDDDHITLAVPEGGEITSVTRDHLIHTSSAAKKQTVYRLSDGKAVVQRAPGAASVWAGRLWTSGAEKGTVTALDIATQKTSEAAATGAGCVPDELQAVGRWVYWSCPSGGPAGVYDRTAKKSVPVPSGEALLGDGWVVTHDKAAGKLVLTAVDTGEARSRTVGELPGTTVSQRHVRWTVDRFGGNAAYVDGEQRVHLVPSGVLGQRMTTAGAPANSTQVTARTFDAVPGDVTTTPLSKPAASWTLTLRDKGTGKVVDTVRGGAAREQLTAHWHGMVPGAQGDAAFPNGTYGWTLSVLPADGNGAALQRTGTVKLRGAAPVRHDFVAGDAVGDLLTLNSSGSFTFQHGTGAGTFSGKTSGSGWSTSAYAVPFGDVNGDRCNDVLVRQPSGELRAYKPGCGKPLTPSTAYTSVGTGWGQYDVLTAPGDMNGDGRTDLVARQASTGDMYFFAGATGGKLAAKVRIGTNWKTYGRITGVGDITGDGKADLLGHDRSGGLWRYDGTGNGTFKARAQVFKDWGRSYNAVVGIGDITGDGKADIVVRDSAGNLFRNDGNGRGSFGGRTQIATGWQGYKGLF
ncbi:VCBS repeat-containing protein [Streptomyces sp. ISL-100]|uniref:FG-GAP repeat domain-containing protein n=1 Tax=Streptomyces sp. ISL-100 TaxID=2819173 RepID=UPI0027E491C6|nr:VCBS repeat-containing protein [Streptomyces sp. ISL-100]